MFCRGAAFAAVASAVCQAPFRPNFRANAVEPPERTGVGRADSSSSRLSAKRVALQTAYLPKRVVKEQQQQQQRTGVERAANPSSRLSAERVAPQTAYLSKRVVKEQEQQPQQRQSQLQQRSPQPEANEVPYTGTLQCGEVAWQQMMKLATDSRLNDNLKPSFGIENHRFREKAVSSPEEAQATLDLWTAWQGYAPQLAVYHNGKVVAAYHIGVYVKGVPLDFGKIAWRDIHHVFQQNNNTQQWLGFDAYTDDEGSRGYVRVQENVPQERAVEALGKWIDQPNALSNDVHQSQLTITRGVHHNRVLAAVYGAPLCVHGTDIFLGEAAWTKYGLDKFVKGGVAVKKDGIEVLTHHDSSGAVRIRANVPRAAVESTFKDFLADSQPEAGVYHNGVLAAIYSNEAQIALSNVDSMEINGKMLFCTEAAWQQYAVDQFIQEGRSELYVGRGNFFALYLSDEPGIAIRVMKDVPACKAAAVFDEWTADSNPDYGIYHNFTLAAVYDSPRYVNGTPLFCNEAVWRRYNFPARERRHLGGTDVKEYAIADGNCRLAIAQGIDKAADQFDQWTCKTKQPDFGLYFEGQLLAVYRAPKSGEDRLSTVTSHRPTNSSGEKYCHGGTAAAADRHAWNAAKLSSSCHRNHPPRV